MSWRKVVAVSVVATGLLAWTLLGVLAEPSAEQDAKKEGKEQTASTKWAPAVASKPLSENVQKGLGFLVQTQLKNGGWGQGEESANMGRGTVHGFVIDNAVRCLLVRAVWIVRPDLRGCLEMKLGAKADVLRQLDWTPSAKVDWRASAPASH